MGVIMVFGIIGLGLAAPIIYPAAFIYVTIENLMKYSGLNRMGVNRLFKQNYGVSPIQYFIRLKIELAKKYIREDNYNISQVSEILGYSSVHYFSLQFKKTTGMSPTEYSTSIKAMSPLDSASQEFMTPTRLDAKKTEG